MSMDFRSIVGEALKQGWTFRKAKRRSHIRLDPPPEKGGGPVFGPSSPSDCRAVRNFLSELRKRGLEFPR